MHDLIISPLAKADMREIGDYIQFELSNPHAAQRIIQRFRDAMQPLRKFPEMGSPLYVIGKQGAQYRYLVCGNYLIFYHIGTDAVQIDRVLYGRRDYLSLLFGDQLTGE